MSKPSLFQALLFVWFHFRLSLCHKNNSKDSTTLAIVGFLRKTSGIYQVRHSEKFWRAPAEPSSNLEILPRYTKQRSIRLTLLTSNDHKQRSLLQRLYLIYYYHLYLAIHHHESHHQIIPCSLVGCSCIHHRDYSSSRAS